MLGRLEGIIGDLRSITFSPDGSRIVSLASTKDGLADIRLWDVRTLRELLHLEHPFLMGGELAFSSDGHQLTYFTEMLPEDRSVVRVTWDATPLETN